MRTTAFLPALLIAASASAQVAVLNFDDITVDNVNYSSGAKGYYGIDGYGATGNSTYGGLIWHANQGDVGLINPHYYRNYSSSYVADLSVYSGMTNRGYANGLVSGNNVMDIGADASMQALPGTTFDLISAYMTSAWQDNLSFTIIGELNGVQKYSMTFVLSSLQPTKIDFNFMLCDTIRFVGSNYLAVDNMVFNLDSTNNPYSGGAVPEPSTYGLALGGLALAVVAMRRRAKK